MALIEFVRNYEDLSTETGFQFKFFCDKCQSGWVSGFEASATGIAGGLLRAAGTFFGGVLGRAASSEYEIRKAVQGPAHDAALKRAVEEGKQRFKKCSRCGHWVCPETCWNASKGLCESCAPDLHEEAAAAQAQAAVQQVQAKAQQIDQTKGLNLDSNIQLRCPACDAQVQGGKFCPSCGAALAVKIGCKGCGAEMKAGAKFCPECGRKAE
jgi:hypothetical protein